MLFFAFKTKGEKENERRNEENKRMNAGLIGSSNRERLLAAKLQHLICESKLIACECEWFVGRGLIWHTSQKSAEG